MTALPVKLTYGKINLSSQSQRLSVWRVKPPFNVESATTTGRKLNTYSSRSQSATSSPDGGGFTTMTVEHDIGTVIKLQASRTRNSRAAADGWLFLRLRASAPRLQVLLSLVHGRESLLGENLIIFEGNADVLTEEELDVLGFHVPGRKRATYMNPDEVAELFQVTELTAGTASRPVYSRIATAAGVTVAAVAAEPVRRIRMRRK